MIYNYYIIYEQHTPVKQDNLKEQIKIDFIVYFFPQN